MNASNLASHYAFEKVASGKSEYANAARTLADCADVAGMTATLTARRSPMAEHMREAMAKCCDVTVSVCEKLNDPMLNASIEACKNAATDCREMQ